MCGIFGMVSKARFEPSLVLSALKKLEYRGYDSWGVAVASASSNQFVVQKSVGKIGNSKVSLPQTQLAIGHTRWATHGGVTVDNAHPHLSASGQIAVVHNGIIENHQKLWNEVVQQSKVVGKKIQKKSQTDSEVFAHLVEVKQVGQALPFLEAVRQSFLQLEGLSAVVVASSSDDSLVVAKTGSPLVIGVGTDRNVVASDVYSVLEYTDRVHFLEDGQMAEITAQEVTILDIATGRKIAKKIETIDWQQEQAAKGSYPHFLAKEIAEQPMVLEKIAYSFRPHIKKLVQLVSKAKKVYLVGCGTAYHAALYSTYILANEAKIEATALSGSEFDHKAHFLDSESLAIFFSQSGETIDSIQAAKKAMSNGATAVALVNVPGSTLQRMADHSVLLQAGPEICVLSTKAFTAMVAIMIGVAAALAKSQAVARQSLIQVGKEIDNIISVEYLEKHLVPVVQVLARSEHAFVLGRGQSYPIALEAALKIKEVTYLHTEGFAAGELKHGVIALIELGTPCILLVPDDSTRSAMLSTAAEVSARGGVVIGISEKPDDVFDFHIPVAEGGVATLISHTVVAQQLAYQVALVRGNDPDKPRNLAKSVTVM